MTDTFVEISTKGDWVKVPALTVGDKTIVLTGKWMKKAVVRSEAWLETELENPELFIQKLRERRAGGFRADIFTFAQKLPATVPRYDYAMEWDSIAATRTTSFKTWWEGLPQESRKNVRRSQKRGVTVTVRPFDDDMVRGIAGVHGDSSVRQGARNLYYGKSLDQIRKDHASFVDRSDFICAYLGDEMIGFLKLVYRGEIASILNLAVKASHYDKRPSNALVTKAVELCEMKGISFLTYGMFNYGNKGDNPLREFKIRNGFEEVLVPRFYVPLTLLGRVCMKAKLHRGFLAILPERVITLSVAGRSKLYNFVRKLREPKAKTTVELPTDVRSANPPAGSSSNV
jgi:hypothetical protein